MTERMVQVPPEYAAALSRSAAALSAFATGPAARAVAARYAQFQSLRGSAQAAGVESQARALFGSVWTDNIKADANAKAYAELLAGLRSGAFELIAWTDSSTTPVRFGVAKKGTLGLPFVPVLWLLGSAAAATAAFVVADLFATAQSTAAEAELVRANTAARVQAVIESVAQTDPAQAQQLAGALAKAQQAAHGATPGLLDKLVSGAQSMVSSVTGGSGGGLILLGLLWLLSRGRA